MHRKYEYIITVPPISWQRAGKCENKFFDRQKQEKLYYGLSLANQHGQMPLFTGPLKVELFFFMPIPKFTKRRCDQELHFKRPDIDNLVKFFYDSATGVLWADDCIIAIVNAEKRYDKNPRTHIIVEDLT